MDDRRGLAGRVWVFRRGMAHRWICLGEFFPTSYIKCPGVNSRTSPLALDHVFAAADGRSAWVGGACMGLPSRNGTPLDLSRGVLSNKLHKMPWSKLADIAIGAGPHRRAADGREGWVGRACMRLPSRNGTPLDLSRGVLSNKLHKMPWSKLADIAIGAGPHRRAADGRSALVGGACMGLP